MPEPVSSHPSGHPARRRWLALLAGLPLLGNGLLAAPASAASVSSAVFTGGTGTATVAGSLFAKQGSMVTLNVTTSSDTKCVAVSGAFTDRQTSNSAKSSWTFTTAAGAGDGAQAVTVAASPNYNGNGCTGQTNSQQASYSLDNTGPVVTGSLSPAPNAAGWNNTNTTLTWSASDAGSGVSGTPTPASSSETSNGIAVRTATATDRLGNSGTGSTTVRVDKAKPQISGGVAYTGGDGVWGTGATVTFTCTDTDSGGGQDSGIASCLADGSSTNAKTVTAVGPVGGTALDKAGNTGTAVVQVDRIDTSAPVLSGAPTTAPNANGWYAGDVAVRWTASDPQSGVPTAPADTTIAGEGTGLTSSQTVTNRAGLSTTAVSAPAVKIDRTAPSTSVSGGSNAWTKDAVTLNLTASDNLSGVASTQYSVDGGAPQTGSEVVLDTDGEHTVRYHSVDKAGNAETARTATVRIDRTAPSITHSFTPQAYTDGAWTNGAVTVTFSCDDQGGSGLASCSGPATRSAEGQHDVTGSAADTAGNVATDTATVRIDTTAPEVSATARGERNDRGWYRAPVIVDFECADALSGVVSCSDSQTIGEGRGRSATGTARDAAGNSGTASVTGIDVDTTAPELAASFAEGWHTDDVTVRWSCTDALSGVASAATDETVIGEGANLTSTGTCTDVAGNVATRTVSGIAIDRSAPTTTASVAAPGAGGWYADGVEVTLKGHDNLSGVASITYTVDDGAARSYTGPFTVGGDGIHEVSFFSTDVAGNTERAGAPLVLRVDKAAPVTTLTNPVVPDSGWFVTSGIPFAFEATDAGSGVAVTYYTVDGGPRLTYGQPFDADLSDGTHDVSYWSVDLAGNVERTRSFSLNQDTVAPSITGRQSPAANAHGWNNGPVTVTFDCEDATSGIRTGVAGCAGDTVLENDGDDQQVRGDAVDVAGNRTSTSYGPVRIDTVKPTLQAVPALPNGAGWYRGDVAVDWVGDDALSGIDADTVPVSSTVSGEGRGLGASAEVADRAGNRASGSVSGLNIDRNAPVVTGRPTTEPNAAGWYSGEVVVDWTCTDPRLADGTAGSGVALCPTSSLVKSDGHGLQVTSSRALDQAGNMAEAASVSGINVDGTAPSTTADNRCVRANDWCTGDTATVLLDAADALSGVAAIHYRVGDGAVQQVAGSRAEVLVPLSGTGRASVTYWATDVAGNREAANSIALKWDNIAPTVTHALTPAPNADGWNRTDVTVRFAATDDDAGSGVAQVSAPVTVSQETAGTLVTGTAKDTAGNVGTDQVNVRLDKTAPSISGAVTSGRVGDNGWYTGPVTVRFTCSDALSGVVACPDPVVLTNGDANTAVGTVSDRAGNTATATLTGIRIDQEAPVLTAKDVTVAGGSFVLGQVPAAGCTATDAGSGVASCAVVVTGGNSSGVGTFTWTATAKDKAGNVTTLVGTYSVTYRFDGFLQPINDTAHQVGVSTSIFKAGSNVPAKLQLKNASGKPVLASTAPVWLTPVKGGATSAPVDESVYTGSADSGTSYKYDAVDQQWHYNWKTGSAAGNYWRVGVRLDDGQTYYVNIGLR